MATLITNSVGPGKDYSSLAAAEAGLQRDLVAADERQVIRCYAFEDTTATTFAGWTTGSDHDIRVTVPAGERHSGVWSTSAYRLNVAAGSPALTVGVAHVTVEYCQLSGADGRAFRGSGGLLDGTRLSHNIFRGTNSTNQLVDFFDWITADQTWRIWNCVFYDVPDFYYALRLNHAHPQATCYVFVHNNTFASLGRGIELQQWVVLNVFNNLFQTTSVSVDNIPGGTVVNDYNSTTRFELGNGVTDGPNDRVDQTFTFIDPSGKDFHLGSSDTGARGRGTDLRDDPYLPVVDDVDGEPRILPFDIGADQRLPAIVTNTVGPGQDYTSLSAAEAGLQRHLVTADERQRIECHDFEDVTPVTFAGWDTGAANFIQVVAADAHGGVWNTSVYRLVTNDSFVLSQDFMELEGLQISCPNSIRIILFNLAGADLLTVTRCIFQGSSSNVFGGINAGGNQTSGNFVTVKVSNCAFYDISNGVNGSAFRGGMGGLGTNHRLYFHHNTCHGVAIPIRVENNAWLLYLRNSLFDDVDNQVILNDGTASLHVGDYNSTSEPNYGDLAAQPNDRVDQTFTFVDPTGKNFLLQASDTGAKDWGTDLSTDPDLPVPDDILTRTRVRPDDIGMHDVDGVFPPILRELAATATATATRIRGIRRSMLSTSTGIASRASALVKELLAAATGAATFMRRISLSKAATGSGSASLRRGLTALLATTATGSATFIKTMARTLATTATGMATFMRRVSLERRATSTGAADATLLKVLRTTLAATATGIATVIPEKETIIRLTLAAASTVSASFMRLVRLTRAATAIGVAERLRRLYRALSATATGRAVIGTGEVSLPCVINATVSPLMPERTVGSLMKERTVKPKC